MGENKILGNAQNVSNINGNGMGEYGNCINLEHKKILIKNLLSL